MIKLTSFFEGNSNKTNKAKNQPSIPIAAYGRNLADRCKEIVDETEVLLTDVSKQSSANPGYQGAANRIKVALTKIKAAMDAFTKVQ